MQRVYLLLRNNKQEGPYSLEELLSLGLKQYDLIWVEGRSFSWSHPSEVEALKPYVATEAPTQNSAPVARQEIKDEPVAVPASPKTVFVSLPGKGDRITSSAPSSEPQAVDLERKADELRRRAENYLQNKQNAVGEEFVETKYARSLNEVEEDYTSWVYNKVAKKKRLNEKPFLLTAMALVVLTLGYFAIDAMSAKETTDVAKGPSLIQPIQKDEKETDENVNTSTNDESPADELIGAVNEDKPIAKKSSTTASKEEKKDLPASASKAKIGSAIPTSATTGATTQQEVAQTEVDNSPNDNTTEPVAAQPEEKKRTLKEKIGGFFEKIKSKKSTETETAEEPSTPGSTTNGSERRATKRGESSNASGSSADLSSYVKVSASQSSGNWMMGVRGLKIILRNNGTEAIKTAVVEVSYYNEENELLDKKLVQFTNVPSKKSATLPAPDHRLADHTEVNLVSAVGDVGYARQ